MIPTITKQKNNNKKKSWPVPLAFCFEQGNFPPIKKEACNWQTRCRCLQPKQGDDMIMQLVSQQGRAMMCLYVETLAVERGGARQPF